MANNTKVAIIGMACRFPGCSSLQKYWENIVNRNECLNYFTKDELKTNNLVTPDLLSNEQFIPVSGTLGTEKEFDAEFFGFAPADAKLLDPQHRHFLECAWEALEHAGTIPDKYNGIVSVFSGMSDSVYLHRNLMQNTECLEDNSQFYIRMATSVSTLSTYLSYLLNLTGKSINVNTACSTGLVTVSEAVEHLLGRKCDLAIAGAASIRHFDRYGYLYHQGGVDSADGYCRPFSQDANGTVFSDGVGVVILKRLEDALADNDTIYAVIEGIGINNDGNDKLSFTAPSISGQLGCINKALQNAGLSAEEIELVEAHGTATALGDVIEFTALRQTYSTQVTKTQFCALGSVKGNIGHSDTAAGIAGLIKVVMALYTKKLPPTLHCDHVNEKLNIQSSPFYINQELSDWNCHRSLRYAAVSSFGVGGTNAHIILSESPQRTLETLDAQKYRLFPISAKSESALIEIKKELSTYLQGMDNINKNSQLANIAYTLQTGRQDFRWRSVAVGKTLDELSSALPTAGIIESLKSSQKKTVFMFPGQGAQYLKMALDLLKCMPHFEKCYKECIAIINQYLHDDMHLIINSEEEIYSSTLYTQLALFIIEYSLAQMMMELGIKPQALIGHSIGEHAAACIAGILSLKDALFVVFHRGRLMDSTKPGVMLAIECTLDEFISYQENLSIELVVVNSPKQCVATGSMVDIDSLEQFLNSIQKPCIRLKSKHAFHSADMETILPEFKSILEQLEFHTPNIPVISNLTGTWLTDEEAIDPDYWCSQLRHTVQFNAGIQTLHESNFNYYIEVGPGFTLSHFVRSTLDLNIDYVVVQNTLPPKKNANDTEHHFLIAIGELWKSGLNINLELLDTTLEKRHIALPTYRFQRQSCWVKPDSNLHVRLNAQPREAWLYQPTWIRKSSLKDLYSNPEHIAQHHWIVFIKESIVADGVVELLSDNKASLTIVKTGELFKQINDRHYTINPNKKSDYHQLFAILYKTVKMPLIILNYFTATTNDHLTSGEPDINHLLDLSFFSALYTTQAYQETYSNDISAKLIYITSGSSQFSLYDKITPINATLAGALSVVQLEQPSLVTQLIDISLEEQLHEDTFFAEATVHNALKLDGSADYPVGVFRAGFRWQLEYHTYESNVEEASLLSNKGVYIITGGLGAIARTLCESIAKSVQSPIFILLVKTPLPDRGLWGHNSANELPKKELERICTIKKLESLGATVFIEQVDITNYEATTTVIQQYRLMYGHINGLIHTAGVAGGGLIQLKDRTSALNVLQPKLHGTYYLADALKESKLDFVILCSSLIAVTGEIGQIDYAAANSFLDAVAKSDLFNTKFITSINWNTWRDIGMAADTPRPNDVSGFGRSNDISSEEGQELFLEIINHPKQHVIISKYNVAEYNKYMKEANPLHLSLTTPIESKNEEISSNDISNINERLTHIWRRVLGRDNVSLNDDFFQLGGHSLNALQLIEKINKSFETKLSVQDIYEFNTIKAISSHIKSSQSEFPNIIFDYKKGDKSQTPVFLCHPISGLVTCFDVLVQAWDLPSPLYALQDPSISLGYSLYSSIKEMAKAYYQAIKQYQSMGPYYLVGYSFGGNVMYEVANILEQEGQEIGLLLLIDAWATCEKDQFPKQQLATMLSDHHHVLSDPFIELAWNRLNMMIENKHSYTNIDITLIKASKIMDIYQRVNSPLNGWEKYTHGHISKKEFDANHQTILNVGYTKDIVNILRDVIYEQVVISN